MKGRRTYFTNRAQPFEMQPALPVTGSRRGRGMYSPLPSNVGGPVLGGFAVMASSSQSAKSAAVAARRRRSTSPPVTLKPGQNPFFEPPQWGEPQPMPSAARVGGTAVDDPSVSSTEVRDMVLQLARDRRDSARIGATNNPPQYSAHPAAAETTTTTAAAPAGWGVVHSHVARPVSVSAVDSSRVDGNHHDLARMAAMLQAADRLARDTERRLVDVQHERHVQSKTIDEQRVRIDDLEEELEEAHRLLSAARKELEGVESLRATVRSLRAELNFAQVDNQRLQSQLSSVQWLQQRSGSAASSSHHAGVAGPTTSRPSAVRPASGHPHLPGESTLTVQDHLRWPSEASDEEQPTPPRASVPARRYPPAGTYVADDRSAPSFHHGGGPLRSATDIVEYVDIADLPRDAPRSLVDTDLEVQAAVVGVPLSSRASMQQANATTPGALHPRPAQPSMARPREVANDSSATDTGRERTPSEGQLPMPNSQRPLPQLSSVASTDLEERSRRASSPAIASRGCAVGSGRSSPTVGQSTTAPRRLPAGTESSQEPTVPRVAAAAVVVVNSTPPDEDVVVVPHHRKRSGGESFLVPLDGSHDHPISHHDGSTAGAAPPEGASKGTKRDDGPSGQPSTKQPLQDERGGGEGRTVRLGRAQLRPKTDEGVLDAPPHPASDERAAPHRFRADPQRDERREEAYRPVADTPQAPSSSSSSRPRTEEGPVPTGDSAPNSPRHIVGLPLPSEAVARREDPETRGGKPTAVPNTARLQHDLTAPPSAPSVLRHESFGTQTPEPPPIQTPAAEHRPPAMAADGFVIVQLPSRPVPSSTALPDIPDQFRHRHYQPPARAPVIPAASYYRGGPHAGAAPAGRSSAPAMYNSIPSPSPDRSERGDDAGRMSRRDDTAAAVSSSGGTQHIYFQRRSSQNGDPPRHLIAPAAPTDALPFSAGGGAGALLGELQQPQMSPQRISYDGTIAWATAPLWAAADRGHLLAGPYGGGGGNGQQQFEDIDAPVEPRTRRTTAPR